MPKVKLEEHNAFDTFKTQKQINDFLSHVYENEEPKVFIAALCDLIDKKGIESVAKRSDVSATAIRRMKRDVDAPFTVIHSILKGLRVNIKLKQTA